MNRILDLQAMATPANDMAPVEGKSSSSDHNCACSTNSAAACFIGDDLIAI